MRQGNVFDQYVDRGPKREVSLRLPLELEESWDEYKYVQWIDNGDGTYTLIPRKELIKRV